MSSPVVLWTIWDSRNKYCSFPAFKLDFSRGKETGLHTPHFCTSKEEQVNSRASCQKLPCTGHISGLVLLSLTKAIPHSYVHFTKTTFGECGETYEYQKYFLWVGGFPPSSLSHIYLFCRLWNMSLWVLHIQKQFFFLISSSSLFYYCYCSPHILLTLVLHSLLWCFRGLNTKCSSISRLKILPDQNSSYLSHTMALT